MEFVFTFLEAMLILGIIGETAGWRFTGIKMVGLLTATALVETFLVLQMDPLPSFLVLLLSFLLDLLLSIFLTQKPFRLRLTGAVLAYFILHSLDYILGFSIAFLTSTGSLFTGFRRVMIHGAYRYLYQSSCKGLQILLFFLLRKYLRRIRDFQARHQWIIVFMLLAAYGMVTLLMQLLITDYHALMQQAIVLSWIFILISMLAMIVVLYITVRVQTEKSSLELTRNMNALMQKNYLQMAESLMLRSRQTHDFKNHLNTIRGLTDNEEVLRYLDSVADSLGSFPPLCRSGNRYIDAVINCKAAEAKAQDIPFSYVVELSDPLEISPADLCSILSNQIDNALEASLRIDDPSLRQVQITISQQQNFTIFRVENSILPGSVKAEDLSFSTKVPDGQRHGLGLINIRQAAERSNGSLHCQIEENRFISIVMVQNSI